MKGALNHFSRALNVEMNPSEGPSFMTKTHLVTVSPRPPETSKEDG